jgi:hypothetical protein
MARGVVFPVDLSFAGDQDTVDYRAVPASDQGNATYRDHGGFGGFSPSREPYPSPSGVTFMDGYGATVDDLKRGFCQPAIRAEPAYDLANYKERYSQPRLPDEDNGNRQVMDNDWDFRGRQRQSRGFLTRPKLPTER